MILNDAIGNPIDWQELDHLLQTQFPIIDQIQGSSSNRYFERTCRGKRIEAIDEYTGAGADIDDGNAEPATGGCRQTRHLGGEFRSCVRTASPRARLFRSSSVETREHQGERDYACGDRDINVFDNVAIGQALMPAPFIVGTLGLQTPAARPSSLH